MCQLNAGVRALCLDKVRNTAQGGNVLVFPDTNIFRRDTTFGDDRCGFSDDQTSTTDRTRTQVNQMPVVDETILRRVLAHRGNGNAIRQS